MLSATPPASGGLAGLGCDWLVLMSLRCALGLQVVILSPHGYFGQTNVLGMPDTGGQVGSSRCRGGDAARAVVGQKQPQAGTHGGAGGTAVALLRLSHQAGQAPQLPPSVYYEDGPTRREDCKHDLPGVVRPFHRPTHPAGGAAAVACSFFQMPIATAHVLCDASHVWPTKAHPLLSRAPRSAANPAT